jgi:hypothetical protein
LPCGPPSSVPVVAGIEFGRGNANNNLWMLRMGTRMKKEDGMGPRAKETEGVQGKGREEEILT